MDIGAKIMFVFESSACAITANMRPTVINSEAGFKTMKDLSLPYATPKHMGKYLI